MSTSYTLLPSASLEDDPRRRRRRLRQFRGGWSSSLCAPPRHGSDCCAYACCGLLLDDQHYYRLTQQLPTPWWKRLLLNLGLPLIVLLVFGYLSTTSGDDDDDKQEEREEWQLVGELVFLTIIVFLLVRGWYVRYQNRQFILRELHRRRNANNDTQLQQQQQQHEVCCKTLCATAVCGCVPRDDYSYAQQEQEDESADLCTCLWNAWSSLCCGTLCRCWCQCCGMCAIAQHNREMETWSDDEITSKLDYVTLEPFEHYSDKLEELRIHHVASFWQHLSALSQLSRKMLHLLSSAIIGLAIFALLRVERNFTLVNLLVVIATFFQAFLILHFVHWRWNRFDLSLDAVVKYFSSGFILSTGMAVVCELLLSTLLGMIRNVVIVVVVVLSPTTSVPDTSSPEDTQKFALEFQKEHIWLFAFFLFLNAFLVAALTEELVKYFGYWMVEHPDMMGEPNNKVSRGAGITVAMVSTALGFACCENLLYVFVYTPPSLANEVATLLARSIFPVHPLAAAIQSLGVCRRDLEKDSQCKLGRIVFPAVFLHGSFDFVLMLMALLQGQEDEDKEDSEHDISNQLPALIFSVVICFIGLLYYFCQAEAQRSRLQELDEQALQHASGEKSPLLV